MNINHVETSFINKYERRVWQPGRAHSSDKKCNDYRDRDRYFCSKAQSFCASTKFLMSLFKSFSTTNVQKNRVLRIITFKKHVWSVWNVIIFGSILINTERRGERREGVNNYSTYKLLQTLQRNSLKIKILS